MAADEHSDLYLKFVEAGTAPDGEAIVAESTTKLDPTGDKPDKLLKGFKDGQFMEVDNFTFGVGKMKQTASEKNKPLTATITPSGTPGGTQQVSIKQPVVTTGADDAAGDHIDPEPVQFERSIDGASAKLMDHLLKRIPFEHATIIKRKSVGSVAAGEVYLRLDFTKVLIKSISWSDSLEVKETVHFVYRTVTMNYRPQLPDGSLGGARQGFWRAAGSDAKPVIL